MNFIADQGFFYYKIMPFGLENARVTYQRLMKKAFEGMTKKEVEVYNDNIIMKTSSIGDHVVDLEKIFERLRQHNM